MRGDGQAIGPAGGLGPLGDSRPQRIAEIALVRTPGGHRKNRRAPHAEQADVAEHVLAVFGSYPDDRFSIAGRERPVRDVADIGEEVAQLAPPGG